VACGQQPAAAPSGSWRLTASTPWLLLLLLLLVVEVMLRQQQGALLLLLLPAAALKPQLPAAAVGEGVPAVLRCLVVWCQGAALLQGMRRRLQE
jgi:hypothetical protein